jgi:hypothetical protein
MDVLSSIDFLVMPYHAFTQPLQPTCGHRRPSPNRVGAGPRCARLPRGHQRVLAWHAAGHCQHHCAPAHTPHGHWHLHAHQGRRVEAAPCGWHGGCQAPICAERMIKVGEANVAMYPLPKDRIGLDTLWDFVVRRCVASFYRGGETFRPGNARVHIGRHGEASRPGVG